MNYQEKVSTRAEVKALYEKVCNMPYVKRYRGYTDTNSYEWDPISQDYVKRAGEYWFDNPGYDPECGVPKVDLEAELKRGLGPVSPTVADVAIMEMGIDESESKKFAEIGKSLAAGYESAVTANDTPRILDSGNRRQFETGAVRDICEGKGRCDLLPLDVVGHALCNPTFAYIAQYMREDGDYERLYDALSSCGIFHDYWTLFLEVAKHFEEGCKKYGDNNWQKGIPTHCYIDSAVRHYLKYLRGDKDEPHDRAFCWNILCCIWTCIHKPELNDYAPKGEKSND